MQQAQKPATEAKAQRDRVLRLEDERRVVLLEPLQRVTQQRIVVAFYGKDASEHHRLRGTIARQRLLGRRLREGEGVANLAIRHVLESRGDVPDLTGVQCVR